VSDAPAITQDMQTHSTFSDGADTLEANAAAAAAAGLVEMTCTDHVRASTDWLPAYVAEIERVRELAPVRLVCGVEAKILDTTGRLDLPAELPAGIEVVYAADHQVALDDGPNHPDAVRERLASGALDAHDVVRQIVTATHACLDRPEKVVIAHLFSILPKIGVRQEDVPLELLEWLADETARTGQRIEVNERYGTPIARTLQPFVDRGVRVLVSTDSHRADTIGRYDHCLEVLRELRLL
jgi:putative hydrolase